MDSDAAARQRFRSFKMGAPAPSFARHSHARSVSLSPDSPPLPPKRPGSHHKRRSSVSTRCESAELMGVSLPDLPPSHPDDNVNLGDKDSVRRRALWALEGKPDLAFSMVEIPEIPSPDDTRSFEFPTKPSFPPGTGFPGKRDSFGKMFASTSLSKDQLGTLVEEEEEEEERERDSEDTRSPVDVEQVREPPRVAGRHRPASLNLRPLSLVQGAAVSVVAGNLPTPASASPSRSHARKPDPILIPSPGNKSAFAYQTPSSRHFSYTRSDDLGMKRRSSISYKRSADSIPRDMFSLPTPESTPVEPRFSLASDQESLVEQPLSVAEQHFLFRSHHVLLSRITELERTLKRQTSRSRHASYTSDASAPTSEPSDEMLQLIADLKAERDELKRDIDGWRHRVTDADKQTNMLAKRIESERREAWVARSRLGLLEVEKSGLEKSLETKDASLSRTLAENEALMRERDGMKVEMMKLNARLKDTNALADECTRLHGALDQERARRKELEKLLDDAGLLNTPKLAHAVNGSRKRSALPGKPIVIRPRGLGFQSIDSESSTTDVESADDSFTKPEFPLAAVVEEEVEFSDEENGLAGYEDEEDSDLSLSSPDGSSIGSADELDIKPVTESDDGAPLPIHQRRSSLSKSWTFPRGKNATPFKRDDEVDRFFGCLDDGDKSPPHSEEITQNVFSSACRFMPEDDEDLSPFFLPSDVGVVIESASSESVPGKDEKAGVADDDLVGEVVEGGIRFTFNPPPIICVTPPDTCVTPPEIQITPSPETWMATPAVRRRVDGSASFIPELTEDDPLTFVFPPKGEPRRAERVTSPPSGGGSRPSTSHGSPPSSIPRAISLRSMSPKAPLIAFTPSRNVSGRFAAPLAYSSPPSKKTPSSIPQPVAAALPRFYTPTKAQTSAVSLKQSQSSTPNGLAFKPHSKLHMSTLDLSVSCASQVNEPTPDLRCPNSNQSGGATSEVNGPNHPDPSSPSAFEYFRAQDSSLSSIKSNPLAAQSPFEKLSHLISFSWAPGATAIASSIVPNSNSGGMDAVASNGATRPARRRFVSRARQLEKLRSRFSLETKNENPPFCMVSACKGCRAGDVFL